jgi:hypothetical protein
MVLTAVFALIAAFFGAVARYIEMQRHFEGRTSSPPTVTGATTVSSTPSAASPSTGTSVNTPAQTHRSGLPPPRTLRDRLAGGGTFEWDAAGKLFWNRKEREYTVVSEHIIEILNSNGTVMKLEFDKKKGERTK